MSRWLPGVAAVVVLAAVPAAARTTATVYGLASRCDDCHDSTSVQPPDLTVHIDPPPPLLAGTTAHVTVNMTSNNNFAERYAAFAAKIGGCAGRMLPGAESEVNRDQHGNAVRDVALRDFNADGTYGWTFDVADLLPGSFTLFVGVNDANGNDRDSGDRNAREEIDFAVDPAGEGEGEGEGESPCALPDAGFVGGEGEGEGPPLPTCACVTDQPAGHGGAVVGAFGLLLVPVLLARPRGRSAPPRLTR